jgi:HAD superfamily hydrolase (TIGR01662 family)
MIRAILFDLDNTLTDFWKFKNECIGAAIQAMAKAGLKIEKKQADEFVVGLYKKGLIEKEDIFQGLLKEVTGEVDERILSEGLKAYRERRKTLLKPYPEVAETINELKKSCKIGIISDAPRKKVLLRLERMEIEKDMFDVLISIEDTNQKKPHPLPFQKAIEKLKVNPDEILMVGDSIHKDMAGAKAAGMHTCLAVYGRTLKPKVNPDGVDFMANRVSDLLEIVKRIK